MRSALSFSLALLIACIVALAAGCATPAPPRAQRAPEDVHAQLLRLLPNHVADKEGWARDIQTPFRVLDIPPSTENLCAVLAVTEQESGFNADPPVAGLPTIARQEIDRRAARMGVPQLAVNAALRLTSADGRSYGERLRNVRSERELSELYQELIARVPLGARFLAGANPVRTAGAMQVGIDYAQRHAREHPYPYSGAAAIRDEVFTRRGGMYFGIAHLLDYPNSYQRHLYRYADYNAGHYASRNAAFQAAVAAASGIALALDGDVLLEGGNKVGATEQAVRSLGPQLGLSDARIRDDLQLGDRFEFERTQTYERVFALAERAGGKPLPRAVVPTIALESPKITRKLTTAWFADRVERRYRNCINRAYVAPAG